MAKVNLHTVSTKRQFIPHMNEGEFLQTFLKCVGNSFLSSAVSGTIVITGDMMFATSLLTIIHGLRPLCTDPPTCGRSAYQISPLLTSNRISPLDCLCTTIARTRMCISVCSIKTCVTSIVSNNNWVYTTSKR